ncbi:MULTISPECIES: ABC transporter ATP-binding protein [Ralstonia]|jgi:ATP-binding cassette subfamily B multidrug efflux pump|uniref:ABC-type multidrug transport system, ATPase and permease component n=1 Tax=Ralstonia pickettii OR214 TaxID=1264675 RepID=R0E9X9_RALPI|nr:MULTISPECIES: ABC transporter ATP-binding protein [Ralstonia]MEA3270720.1 ABC transporter ATP-binding protein [Pseudomonadota bacterium]ENZ78162.1 ABC-type multidrug transport system, ATPase and permease component [Ralstonia pickettii OR214]MBL4776099.1 ABC transporter ATP-binding protein [Ralstonia sp.]MCM3580700.1 ABC transporter ATP-binding protein/permease [Ralstonia pickettii]OYU22852.1 MAG: ABC transporter ATP-binding protein [Ralstonia sp. PBBBR1]
MLLRRLEKLIDPFRPLPDTQPPANVWRFYAHFLREVRGVFALLLLVGLLGALIEVALFDFLGRIVDMIQATPGAEFFGRHRSELLWMAFVALIARPVIFGLHDVLVHQVINPNLSNLIRWQNHRYVLKQSLTFFQNDFAGRIAQRIMQTGFSLRDSAVQAVDALWHVVIYALSAMVLFARADWWLVVPLLVWIGCYIAALSYFVPRVKARSVIATESRSKLMGRIVDGYTNITTLKLFAHTQHEESYARDAMAEQTDKTRLSGRMISGMDFTITAMNGLLIVGTSALALWLWSQGRVSAGTIALTTGLVIRINNMSGWIMWVVNGIFENVGQVQDGMQTIALPRAVIDQPDAKPLQVTRGEVRFEHVGFHYGKGSGVIEGLDLVVRPGERIGLVGPSGAGKSTLVNLLLRLYDVERGRILVDGQDIAAVTQESLREQIGMVTQDTSLLHRSIRDNLRYGKPDSTEAELMQAVRRARADEFIPQLSDAQGRRGFDALVGERGVKLSGGQRQRIAIARVLLKDAPILILDEATSALDSEVEAAIQESLETLMQGKTVIAIAHRLSTIARMDRLVVLDGGRIVESGTHAELLEHGGLYARLWAHQTGGFVGVD